MKIFVILFFFLFNQSVSAKNSNDELMNLLNGPDHAVCADEFDPFDKNIENTRLYWECRDNIEKKRNIKKEDPNAKMIKQKIEKLNRSKYSNSRSILPEDEAICNANGFKYSGSHTINTIKFYRCLKMLLLTNGDLNRTNIEEIEDLSDIKHVVTNNKCYVDLEVELAIKDYNSVVDCRNIIHLKFPFELTQQRTKDVRFADEDGDINVGKLKLDPTLKPKELKILRNKAYQDCLDTKNHNKVKARQIGIQRCK